MKKLAANPILADYLILFMAKVPKKLTAKYSKRERDIVYVYPFGIQTKCDASYLNDKLEEIRVEMERRGYDWQTMKFEIQPKLPNFERFPTLSGKQLL